jgi:UDP-3-O-[3-hydroxymyristoyl] glucosamine N-acyltransferase
MIGNRLKMGDNSTIWFGTYIGENVSIGSNVLIGT